MTRPGHLRTVALYTGATLAALAAGWRFLADVTGSILGTTVSCGNALGYAAGRDVHATGLALATCRSALASATFSAMAFLALAVALLVAAIVSTVTEDRRRYTLSGPLPWPPPWPPGTPPWPPPWPPSRRMTGSSGACNGREREEVGGDS